MNAQRHGSNLRTDIRIALSSLGRDPHINLSRLTIKQLEEKLIALRAEQRAAGGILKEAV